MANKARHRATEWFYDWWGKQSVAEGVEGFFDSIYLLLDAKQHQEPALSTDEDLDCF